MTKDKWTGRKKAMLSLGTWDQTTVPGAPARQWQATSRSGKLLLEWVPLISGAWVWKSEERERGCVNAGLLHWEMRSGLKIDRFLHQSILQATVCLWPQVPWQVEGQSVSRRGPSRALQEEEPVLGRKRGGQWGVQLWHLREKCVEQPLRGSRGIATLGMPGRGRGWVPAISGILQEAGCGPGSIGGPELPWVLIKWHEFLIMKRMKVGFNCDVLWKQRFRTDNVQSLFTMFALTARTTAIGHPTEREKRVLIGDIIY